LSLVMREAALSHNDLCDAVGVGGSTIDQWVAGKTVPSALVLDDVCRFLDCTLEDIYPRDEE
jgi:DNA-binding XRE family transcriptional regulator